MFGISLIVNKIRHAMTKADQTEDISLDAKCKQVKSQRVTSAKVPTEIEIPGCMC